MSRYVTVRCDGNRCSTSSTTLKHAAEIGWLLSDETDLCKHCSKGKCNAEFGPYDCSCLLELNHQGLCRCSCDINKDV